jgi:3-oxoadipate enol-lactonase
MPQLVLDDVPLYYETSGTGFPLLAINAFSFNLRVWDRLRWPLSAKYRLITFDLRGHGKSSAPATGYSTLDYNHDLEALVKGLELKQLCLMGHSTGANIALEYTLQNPERIKALILVDPLINGMRFPRSWHDAYRAFRKITLTEGLNAGLEKGWLQNPIFEEFKCNKSRLMFIKDVVRSFSGLPIREMETFPFTDQALERVSCIACPTLIIYGEKNFEECIDVAERLSIKIPQSKKVMLHGLGHLSPIQGPSTFTREVLQFLSEIV